jgi:hypothetical protein
MNNILRVGVFGVLGYACYQDKSSLAMFFVGIFGLLAMFNLMQMKKGGTKHEQSRIS